MGMIGISKTPLRLPHCDACGEMRVIHPLEKFLSWIEERTEHESQRTVPQSKQSAENSYTRARIYASLGIARLREDATHTQDSRVHALFEGARAAGLTLLDYEFLGKHLRYFLRDAHGKTLSFIHLPHELLPYHAPICIDDKYALAKHLHSLNMRAPKTWCVKSMQEPAITDIFPLTVVTKPCIGTRGRHTTLHHKDERSLQEGIRIALQVSTRVVIQEEIQGIVYRFTVVSGSSVYVGKREYPYVVGDGASTIEQLIAVENRNPIRDGIYFRHIPFGTHEKNFLLGRGLSPTHIPQKGERCIVSDKNSRRNGTVVDDVTDEVHPTIREYIIAAARSLKSPILGFDVILQNHTRSIHEQAAGIIECNSVPYLDVHHRVASGKSYNVAAELFSLVTAEYDLQQN